MSDYLRTSRPHFSDPSSLAHGRRPVTSRTLLVDSRKRQDYEGTSSNKYRFVLPEPLQSVSQMALKWVHVPHPVNNVRSGYNNVIKYSYPVEGASLDLSGGGYENAKSSSVVESFALYKGVLLEVGGDVTLKFYTTSECVTKSDSVLLKGPVQTDSGVYTYVDVTYVEAKVLYLKPEGYDQPLKLVIHDFQHELVIPDGVYDVTSFSVVLQNGIIRQSTAPVTVDSDTTTDRIRITRSFPTKSVGLAFFVDTLAISELLGVERGFHQVGEAGLQSIRHMRFDAETVFDVTCPQLSTNQIITSVKDLLFTYPVTAPANSLISGNSDIYTWQYHENLDIRFIDITLLHGNGDLLSNRNADHVFMFEFTLN